MPSIPASQIVSSTPSVLSGGGLGLDLNGLMLTQSTRVPIGQVLSFPTLSTLGNFFGLLSTEYALAAVYFTGSDNSSLKPGALLVAQYNSTAVSAWLRSTSIANLSLSQLQGISGSLVISIDGVLHTANINLSGATSFSAAASLIQTALVTAGFTGVTVNYDSVTGTLQIFSASTGSSSTISYGSGSFADAIGFTLVTGATISQGAAITTPLQTMNLVQNQTQNWVTFFTAFEPNASDKLAFASWLNSTIDRYAYICWDTDVSPTTGTAPSSVGATLQANGSSGTAMVYQDMVIAAFVSGAIASIDQTEFNGRTTMAFRSQAGLTPTVTDAGIAKNLMANGYNFYGSYATANDQFNFLYNGQVSGPFEWLDSYINQIILNNAFQLAIMVAFTQSKSIPYNIDGYAIIKAALSDPIKAALNFGSIRAGVTLSDFQAAEVNSEAGEKIDDILSNRGWFLKIFTATAQVRSNRQSPPCKFWYTDGESIQSLNINSVEIQ